MRAARSIALIIGMLLLILYSDIALQGAREGLVLCVSSVIPALLPFWVLSSLLTRNLWGNCGKMWSFLGRLFSIPQGAESLLIPAFLGGYPAGAGCIGAAYEEGRLEKQQAQRLLGYCNNVGPAFLFGIVAPQLESPWDGVFLWLIQILGAWTASWLLPGNQDTSASVGTASSEDILGNAVISMGKICVCVILFRVILVFANRGIPSSGIAGVMLSGLVELTNGCCHLKLLPAGLRLPAAAAWMSLGGICVALQTASVTKGLGLGLYALGKCIACLIAILGAWCPWSVVFLPILWFVKRAFKQKSGGSMVESSAEYKKKSTPKACLTFGGRGGT